MIVALGDGAAGNDASPSPQLLDDDLSVDGQGERLLHQRIVERRPPRVHGEHVEPAVERAAHDGAGVGLDSLALVGRNLGDQVHLALEQGRHAGCHLGQGPNDEPIEVHPAAPVVRVRFEHDPVVLRPRDEAHGSRTDRLLAEGVGADGVQVSLGHDLPAVEPESRRQQRIGLLGVDDQRRRVRRLDPLHGREDGADPHFGIGIVRALDAELRVGRAEGVAVVPLDALAHLEHPRRLALELPFRREARRQLSVRPPARQVVEEIERDTDIVR